MNTTMVSDTTTFDCENDSSISEVLLFLKSSFRSEDFNKAERILRSREKKIKLEEEAELKTEIRDLECRRRRAEEEGEVWKKKFEELATRICMLEKEATVLRCSSNVDRKQPADEAQVKMDGNKASTSEREANGGLTGTGVGSLQINENMVNTNEDVPGIAGFNNPSHVKESRGLPSIDMQRKSLVNAKEEINSTPSESDMDGQRVRKQSAFELETRICMLEEEATVLRCNVDGFCGKQPDELSNEAQVKMDGNKDSTSEREANGGLNGTGTGVGRLQINENMVNTNENVAGIAGFNNPSHVKESRGKHIAGITTPKNLSPKKVIKKNTITLAKKSAKKKKKKKNSKKQQANNYHFRSALAPLVDDIKRIKGLIKDRHLELIKKTPFATLFLALHAGKIDSESCKKSNDALMKILDTYDKRRNGFQIGTKFLKFTARDMSVIFGIPLKDEKKDKRKKDDIFKKEDRPAMLFWKRNFQNQYMAKKKDITTAIGELLPSEKEEDVKDCCIMICGLMFCSLFFPYGSGALSKPILLSLYEEIETANWPKRILKELLISASQYKDMQSAPGGCTMALLYWLAEHVSITSMKEGKDEEIPRVVRWDIKQIMEVIRATDFSAIEDSKITENLILSNIEKNIVFGNFEEEEESEEESEEEENEDNGKRATKALQKTKKEVKDASTSEREANGGLNGTGVGSLQINENMVNTNEDVPGIAGFDNPSHVKESRVLPSIDMQRKSLVNANEEINSTPSESDIDGQRVRKQPAFELEGNSNRKLSPELDNLKTTPGGIIDISDSEDETDIAPNHASNLRDSEMVENEKEPSSRKCIKRLYSDQSRDENESICEENPVTLTPKRGRPIILTSESEDDDNIPISKLRMTKLENPDELAHSLSGSLMKLRSQMLPSGSDNVEESISPSGKRLLSLRKCEEKNSTVVNKCPSDTKYPNNLNMSDQKARSALVESDSSDSSTDSKDEGDNDLGFNQVIAALRRKKR